MPHTPRRNRLPPAMITLPLLLSGSACQLMEKRISDGPYAGEWVTADHRSTNVIIHFGWSVLCYPFDVVFGTVDALDSISNRDKRLKGGIAGWVLSLVPGFTCCSGMSYYPKAPPSRSTTRESRYREETATSREEQREAELASKYLHLEGAWSRAGFEEEFAGLAGERDIERPLEVGYYMTGDIGSSSLTITLHVAVAKGMTLPSDADRIRILLWGKPTGGGALQHKAFQVRVSELPFEKQLLPLRWPADWELETWSAHRN
jgi:hypothetical protein